MGRLVDRGPTAHVFRERPAAKPAVAAVECERKDRRVNRRRRDARSWPMGGPITESAWVLIGLIPDIQIDAACKDLVGVRSEDLLQGRTR